MTSPFEFLQCICGNKLTEIKNSMICKNCSECFKIVNNEKCVIFKEVYKVNDGSFKPFNLSNKQLEKSGNWRAQNYKITKKWIDHLPDNNLIIDLGCGALKNYELLKKQRPIFVDGAKFDGVNIVCDFNNSIPLKNNSADAILCSNVLEHLPEPKKFIREISRILKEGGECLILVPFVIKNHQEPFDFHRYTKYGLEYYINDAGLKNFEIIEVGGISNILGTIYKVALEEKINLIQKILINVQYFIWKIMRKMFGDDTPSKDMPQGYAVYIKK